MDLAPTPILNYIMLSSPLLLRVNGPTYYPMHWNLVGWQLKWVDREQPTASRKLLKHRFGWLPVKKRKPWSQVNIFIIKNFGIFTLQLQMPLYRKNTLQHVPVYPESHFQWYKLGYFLYDATT